MPRMSGKSPVVVLRLCRDERRVYTRPVFTLRLLSGAQFAVCVGFVVGVERRFRISVGQLVLHVPAASVSQRGGLV